MEIMENDPEMKSEEQEVNDKPIPHEPEAESTEMIVKPFCECANCTHWRQSADWCSTPHLNFENQRSKILTKDRKVQPLIRSTNNPGEVPKIIAHDSAKGTTLEKQAFAKILIHGEIIPKPTTLISDCYFSDDIQLSLEKLKYKYSKPIQSFAWPAIFRQMNVFMIGGPKSGKTMAYLPAICTFSSQGDEKYSDFAKYHGPLAVIVCNNSRQCEEIYDLVKKLFSNSVISRPKVAIVTYPINKIHNTDILITIPEALISCIQSRIINFKRLCHLVFEDASNLLARHQQSINQILSAVDNMLEHRVYSYSVQLIVTSEKWSNDLKEFYKSIYVTPLVCFDNCLEAAFYGNAHFEIKFLMKKNKMDYLKETLEDNFHVFKTIVICDNSEIRELNSWLNKNQIATICVSDESSKEQIQTSEEEWTCSRGGLHKVLLCTDFIFDSLLCITDAMCLVNYSFASTWTRFSMRFNAMSSNYVCPWESNEQLQCKSIIIIDETCEQQMRRILNLLNRLGKELPPSYQQYAEGFKFNSENEKIAEKVPLCEQLKMFGKCSHSLCENRHMLSPDLDVSEDLPKSGKVVFKVLQVKSAARYIVQLIEHIDLNGCVHEINNDDLKKPLTYDHDENQKLLEEITLGKYCVHCECTVDGNEYRLCHVVSVSNDKFVEVKLTTGIVLQTLKTKLFEVPSNLKIVEIYLSDVIPRFKDENFSGRSLFVTVSSLESMDYKNIQLTADIDLQLDHTLWVHNVIQIFKVDQSEVIKFDLINHLKKKLQVVDISKDQLASLRKLCQKCDIKLPICAKPIPKKVVAKKDIKPQTAFLDKNINEVLIISAVSPEEFYVRLTKYQCLLNNLEEDITEALQEPLLEKNVIPSIGNYYLAPDPSGKQYSRTLLLNFKNGRALCFYVDYGDEGIVNTSDLRILPTKLLTKLPFQAIQCRLHGISPILKNWSDEATDVLYNYMFEPDSDIFRSLFVRVCDKETINGKEVYSVLLKDGYGSKNALINQIMLDCGFAKSLTQKIEDFSLSELQQTADSEESDLELDKGEDVEEMAYEEENFDLEITDMEEFLKMLGMDHLIKQKSPSQLTDGKEELNYSRITMESITANNGNLQNEAPTSLTPEIYWNQNENTIRMKIKLIGVQDYKASVFQKRIFVFSTILDGKNYQVKFTLHKPAEMTEHRALGQEVVVVLNKVESVEWMQLTGTNKKLRFVHYEVPEEKEKPKRKILQLDITDDESDENQENIMIHEISDMDSEFDQDVVSSSED